MNTIKPKPENSTKKEVGKVVNREESLLFTLKNVFRSKPKKTGQAKGPEDRLLLESPYSAPYSDRQILDFWGQWRWLLIGNIYSKCIVPVIVLLWAGLFGLIFKVTYGFFGDGWLAGLAVLAYMVLSLQGLTKLFSHHYEQDIPSEPLPCMGIPKLFGIRITSFVMTEGWAVYIPWGIFTHDTVSIQMVNVDDQALEIPIAGGAYVEVRYSFSFRPILKMLKEFINAGGHAIEKKDDLGILDRIDDMVESALRREFVDRSLHDVQALDDELLKQVTKDILKDLNPLHEDKEDFLVTFLKPALLLAIGTAIFNFKITKVNPSDDIKKAQSKIMQETIERSSDLLNELTKIRQAMFNIKFYKDLGVEYDPVMILNQKFEDESIAKGVKTIPGAQAALAAYAQTLSKGTKIEKNMDTMLDEWLKNDVKAMTKEFDSMAEMLSSLGKSQKKHTKEEEDEKKKTE